MECYQRGVDAKAVSQVPDPPGLLGRQSSAVPPTPETGQSIHTLQLLRSLQLALLFSLKVDSAGRPTSNPVVHTAQR